MFGKKTTWLFAGQALYSWWKRRRLQGPRIRGDSWMPRETRALFSDGNHGLLLDGVRSRLSLDASCRNVAVIATTRAGKTASLHPAEYSLPERRLHGAYRSIGHAL